jgi:hypothetical protein
MQKTAGTFGGVAWTYLTQKTTSGATVAIQKTGGAIHGTTYTEVSGK